MTATTQTLGRLTPCAAHSLARHGDDKESLMIKSQGLRLRDPLIISGNPYR
jgi:hypothetical protein